MIGWVTLADDMASWIRTIYQRILFKIFFLKNVLKFVQKFLKKLLKSFIDKLCSETVTERNCFFIITSLNKFWSSSKEFEKLMKKKVGLKKDSAVRRR